MDNMFIKKRDIKEIGFDVPQFINSGVNPSEIAHKSNLETSGNTLIDMAMDKAINYSKKLDMIKANNEKAKHSIALQNKINDYENEWQEKGLNKYSDENYSEYLSGLNAIYDNAKMEFANTKYTNENDVYEWHNGIDKARGQNIYLQNGSKAKFDIEATTDETLVNVSAMANNYIQAGNYADLENAIGLLDELKVFIPKHKLDALKRNQVMTAERGRMNTMVESIINSNSSIEEKQQALTQLQNNVMKNKGSYALMAENAVAKGLYDDVKLAESDYKAMYQEAFNSNGAQLNRLNDKIRADKAQVDIAKMSLEGKWDTAIKNTSETYIKAKNTNQQQSQISILEGRNVDLFDVAETSTVNRYYGVESGLASVIKTDEDGRPIFIPTMSNGETQYLQEQRNIVRNDPNRNYSDTMGVYSEYVMSGRNEVEQKNRIYELEHKGFITPFYREVLIGKLGGEEYSQSDLVKGSTNEQIINYQYKGAKLVTSETESKKIKTFGLSQSLLKGTIKNKMEGLTPEQRHYVNGMIAGLYNSGEVENFNTEELSISRLNKYMDVECSDGITVESKIDGFIEMAKTQVGKPRPKVAKMVQFTEDTVRDRIEENVANGMNKVIRVDSKEVGLEPKYAMIGTQIREERKAKREQAKKLFEEQKAKQKAFEDEDILFNDWN